jgi:protein-S-isoprenylcysteine O-methyltransferase Ste14
MTSISSLIGKPTMHPVLFYSGKIAGYLTWVIFLLILCHVRIIGKQHVNNIINTLSLIIMMIGFVFLLLSIISLGRSTRLGLPRAHIDLKTGGIYQISRNPMYIGFDLLTVSSMLYSGNLIVVVLGLYSIVIYHLIILGEERFLAARFGEKYLKYKQSVGRYMF